jgi:NAD-dependent dihydropyrimidine dehydrogenase PreA subunit
MGTFIQVKIKEAIPIAQAEDIVRLCPVDIFMLSENGLSVIADNEDECTLCALCLKAAPPDAIHIKKSYKDEVLISTGEAAL